MTRFRSVFVSSDHDHMLGVLSKHFGRGDVSFVTLGRDVDDPHLDLAVLGGAEHFVGNCVSSFSAFVKRERDVRRLQSSFWAFPPRGEGRRTHDPGEL